MEHKHKLLATASSQAQGACSESMIDRFSNLADEVSHHILSFVDLKGLTRVGSVSKRCRGFYLSTPSLNFYSWKYANKQEQINMLNCFERFLIHRGDNIHYFRIHLDKCSSLCDEMFRVITWIHIATRCNVEVLDLEFRNCKPELPSSIFLCGSLRSLSVNMYSVLKVPCFAGPTNLQHLNLSNVTIVERFSKWISSSCKCIKKLELYNVKTDCITIESSSLESFRLECPCSELCHLNISGEKLEDIHIEWGFVKFEPGNRLLNIFAPNLKYLKWTGKLLNRQNLRKLVSLEKAEIFLETKADVYDLDNAFEVLWSLCRVKVLILSDKPTKVLYKEGSMPAPFDNISYLGMHVASLSDDLIPAMVSLLRGMSNLNTLFVKSDKASLFHKPKAHGFNRKYWKSQNLDFIYQLKEVTIELSNGFNALELARYILEQAPNLKKMIIFYLPHQSYVIKKVKETKMLSTATVVLHKKQLR